MLRFPFHLGSGCFYGKGGTGMLYNRLRGVEQFGYLTLEYPPPMSMRSSPETERFRDAVRTTQRRSHRTDAREPQLCRSIFWNILKIDIE
jgi:hypothetical protein